MSSYVPSGKPVFNASGSSADIRAEFTLIQTAVDSKADKASPTFTGTVTVPSPFNLGATSVTTTGAELNKLSGVTTTTAQLNYLNNLTSDVQTQLNAKAPLASPALTGNVSVYYGANPRLVSSSSDITMSAKTGGSYLKIDDLFDTIYLTTTTGSISFTTTTGQLRMVTSSAPASASAAGTAGEIRIDDNYIYRCVATNTWKRAALSTW